MSRMLVMPIGVMKLIFMRYMLIIFINIHGRLWGAIVVDFDHLVPGETWILGWLHNQIVLSKLYGKFSCSLQCQRHSSTTSPVVCTDDISS